MGGKSWQLVFPPFAYEPHWLKGHFYIFTLNDGSLYVSTFSFSFLVNQNLLICVQKLFDGFY